MPDSLNENSNWLAVPHEQIWREINTGPGVASAVPTGDFYAKASQAVADAQQNLRTGLTRLTAGWQGAAATEAIAAIDRLHGWAGTAQQGLEAARIASAQQAQHYSDARSKIPVPAKAAATAPPAGTGPGLAVGTNTDQDALERAQHDGHHKAAEAMATYQAESARTVSALPVYNSAPDVAIIVGGTVFTGAGSSADGRSGDASLARPDAQPQDATRSAAIPGQQTGPVSTTHQVAAVPGVSGAMLSSTTPAGLPTMHASTAPLAPGAQTGSSFGAAGSGIIGGVLGGGGSGTTTRKQSGGRGATSSGRAAEAPKAAQRSGEPGSGIMQPASGRSEDDREHDNKFVLTGDDVFTLDDMVAPTVIGAEEDNQ